MSMDKFKALLAEKEVLLVARKGELGALDEAFKAECMAAWKVKFPRRKFSMAKSAKENQPFHGDAYKRGLEGFQVPYKRWDDRFKEMEAKLDSEALETAIPASKSMSLYATVNSGRYSSQGFGEHKYARADADDRADKAKSYGLKAEVREVVLSEGRDVSGFPYRCVDYEVWVSADEVGCEVLRRKPDKESEADWLKKCDRRGVNPRVYNPFMTYERVEEVRRGK